VRLFFYGTLLDPDVQSLVLGRVLGAGDLTTAVLRHFRRVYIAGRSYPMIVPHHGGAVHGAVTSLSRDELARIARYEGAGYRLERHGVWPHGADARSATTPVFAWLYRSRPDSRPSTREWRLSAWQAKDKAVYLRNVLAEQRP
jgi:gamma-glutamylcyclotransferase (GGCT)/AIG2-like uncharacterized protein YtfP